MPTFLVLLQERGGIDVCIVHPHHGDGCAYPLVGHLHTCTANGVYTVPVACVLREQRWLGVLQVQEEPAASVTDLTAIAE